MSPRPCYAYLHGFASGPLSTKGVMLADAFAARDLVMHRPDLSMPSFSQLTYTAALGAMDALDQAHGAGAVWRLVGSSMGGYLAARWAQLHPDRVDRLLLLCPAFSMLERWHKMLGEEAMALWEHNGGFFFPDAIGEPTAVHWELIEDMRRHPPFPDVGCAARIIHGTRDETVPVESSRIFAADRSHVTLVETDDVHDLSRSGEIIVREAIRFLV